MKKVITILICFILLLVPFTALAEEACEHSYKITHFDEEGTATIKCSLCGNTYTDKFIDHVNTDKENPNYDPIFDVYPDGYINAKDYHILATSVYGDDFEVVDFTSIEENLSDIKLCFIMVVASIGIIIGTIFLKDFNFWKW